MARSIIIGGYSAGDDTADVYVWDEYLARSIIIRGYSAGDDTAYVCLGRISRHRYSGKFVLKYCTSTYEYLLCGFVVIIPIFRFRH